MHDAVIVSAVRTAVGKAPKGTLSVMRPDELGAAAISAALSRAPGFDPALVDDVILGCAMPEAEQGLNVARIASLRAGIPVEASAVTVNRFCSSGLQAIAYGAERIMLGQAQAVVAGGAESMSLVPMGGNKVSPNPVLVATYPDVYLSTGLVAENHARLSAISREDQDAFALGSHQRALAAIEAGRFKDEIVPVAIPQKKGDPVVFDSDEYINRKTNAEALAGLRPAFDKAGSVTAGNASGINDGAAAVVVMSARKAAELGCKPLARIRAFATSGLDPATMGLGPVPATRKVLSRAGWEAGDVDLFELNEAFAAQACAVNKELGIDSVRVNVNGGAIALGHPIGASGCRVLVTLLHEMRRREAKKGIAALCIGGGMGVAMALERT